MGCPLQELNLYYLMCAETLRYDFHQGADSVELGEKRFSSELQGPKPQAGFDPATSCL